MRTVVLSNSVSAMRLTFRRGKSYLWICRTYSSIPNFVRYHHSENLPRVEDEDFATKINVINKRAPRFFGLYAMRQAEPHLSFLCFGSTLGPLVLILRLTSSMSVRIALRMAVMDMTSAIRIRVTDKPVYARPKDRLCRYKERAGNMLYTTCAFLTTNHQLPCLGGNRVKVIK